MSEKYPFQAEPLPYDYVSLMPQCDADTLYLHHSSICGRCRDILNYLLQPYPQYYEWNLEQLIRNQLNLPIPVRNNIKFYAGALYIHPLYFNGLTGHSQQETTSLKLKKKIADTYGSLEEFKDLFKQATFNVLGVGFVWLLAESNGDIHISITKNYDLPSEALHPIFVIDMWEHAYYLRYPAQPATYVDNWFDILCWKTAEFNYLKAIGN